MTPIKKKIIFVAACGLIGAVVLTWVGVESYPNLDKPAHYLMHVTFGLILGYFFGLLCIMISFLWHIDD